MTPDEQAFWDACFLTLLKHDTNNTIEDCMDNADLALSERRKRTGQPAAQPTYYVDPKRLIPEVEQLAKEVLG